MLGTHRSGRHLVGVDFTKERLGESQKPIGTARLHLDGETVAEQEIRTIAAFYALCGEGLCIGFDSGDAVSSAYKPRFEWSGGEIIDVDVERELAAAMARD